jgi:hypothetical protein
MVESGDLAVERHRGVARGVRDRDDQVVRAIREGGRVEWEVGIERPLTWLEVEERGERICRLPHVAAVAPVFVDECGAGGRAVDGEHRLIDPRAGVFCVEGEIRDTGEGGSRREFPFHGGDRGLGGLFEGYVGRVEVHDSGVARWIVFALFAQAQRSKASGI